MNARPTSELPRLWLNRDVDLDWLIALEFGRVTDGQPHDNWRPLSEDFAYLHSGLPDEAPAIGFQANSFSKFDPEDEGLEEIWGEPNFHVPQLGLSSASAGAIILATRPWLGEDHTLNREFFNGGTQRTGDDAVAHWWACLQTGDLMAAFALGYTWYELGEHHKAYRYLRYYSEIAPCQPWTHCWLGKAAAAIGETTEARAAYAKAIELTEAGGEATEARELLAKLEAQHQA